MPPVPRHAAPLPIQALRAATEAHIASHGDEGPTCVVCSAYLRAVLESHP